MEKEIPISLGRIKRYWPLFALILVGILAATALQWGIGGSLRRWMHSFMGFFFCKFALLKLFHPSLFADGYQRYDLLAKRSRFYAYLYPVLELALGLAYLSFFAPPFTYIATILLMGFSSVGVISALRKGLDLRCACMGTVLDVPLSTVTLTEDISMSLMALWMLLF